MKFDIKKILFFSTLIFTAAHGANGQSGGTLSTPRVSAANNGLISSNTRYGSAAGKQEISYETALVQYESIGGSPFLHGGEIVVDFITARDSLLKAVRIRYDNYNQEIIVHQEDGTTMVLDQRYYKGFVYSHEGAVEHYARLRPNDPTFYQVLFAREDFVFCKKDKTTVIADTRYVPGQENKSQKFFHNTEYFVLRGSTLAPVSLAKEGLVDLLPPAYQTQVPQVKEQLKIRRLSKEDDYIRVLQAIAGPEQAGG